jgi:hypothetical protein
VVEQVAITIYWLSKASAVSTDFRQQLDNSAFARLFGGHCGQPLFSPTDTSKVLNSLLNPLSTVVIYTRELQWHLPHKYSLGVGVGYTMGNSGASIIKN